MGVGGQNHAPTNLPQGKDAVPNMGLGSGLDGCVKSHPHRDSNPKQEMKRNVLKNKLDLSARDIKVPSFHD
jgi:hypothetical protein